MKNPLRYEISNWSQIVKCQSNSSKQLHLKYIRVFGDTLVGDVIKVEHEKYGTLFSCLVNGSGSLLMEASDGYVFELDPDTILRELEKFGFFIQFATVYNIDGDQIKFLIDVKNLGMDKIRFLDVEPSRSNSSNMKVAQRKLVAFKIDNNPRWIENTYICPEDEFNKAMLSGLAINLSMFSVVKDKNWAFLNNKVLSIQDILIAVEDELKEVKSNEY